MGELHSLLPSSIIHRDLKAANVLLSSADLPRAVAKVTDFGVATFVQTVRATVSGGGATGTLAWMAPETFDGKYSEKSDIFAFAVLCYEVMSRALPHANKSAAEVSKLVMQQFKVSKALEKKGVSREEQLDEWLEENPLGARRPDLGQVQAGCPQALVDLTERCWDDSPDNRPVSAEILDALARLIEGRPYWGIGGGVRESSWQRGRRSRQWNRPSAIPCRPINMWT